MASDIKRVWSKYCKLWHDLSGWKLFLFYTLHYSLLFVILQFFTFSAFYKYEKTFIWRTDGFGAYIPRLIYISQTFRESIQNFLSGNGWTIPLYDFRLAPAQMDLQIEPFQWLAVLWPWDSIDVLYDFLVLLRFYFVGLSFSVMGFYFKQNPVAIMIGAISYTFCGFSIYGGVRHPFFLTPMILLSLLIVGAEEVLKDKKGWLFICAVWSAMVSSLYFSCMLALLIILYILIRYFCIYNQDGLKSFLQMLGKFFLWGGTGIALSGIITIPTLLQMMGTGRIGRDVGELWHYSADVYQKFLSSFIIIPDSIFTWSLFGFSVMAVPAVILLFVDRTQNDNIKSLKIIFIILTIMLCIPAVTYIMSGFNGISGRWCFAYALCVSFVITVKMPILQYEIKNIVLLCLGGSLLYILICYFVLNHKFYYEASAMLLLLSILLLACCYFAGIQGKKIILPMCLVLTCISIGYSTFLMYSPEARNYVSEFIDKKSAYEIYSATQYGSLGQSNIIQNDDEFFRVSASNIGRRDATMSFYWGLNGLSLYTTSIVDSYKSIENDLEIMQREQNNWKFGIEGRTPILSLFNIKYYALRGSAPVPYGFEEIDRSDRDIILENKYFLPLGYTYDCYMPKDKFDLLNAVEKQETMLQSVVVDDIANSIGVSSGNINILSQKLPAEVVSVSGLTWDNGQLKIEEEKAVMTLSFEGIPNADTYLRVVNLDLDSGYSTRRWDLSVQTETTATYARFSANAHMYAHGLKSQVIYLGNSPEGYTTCTLTFPTKGTFMLDDLEIWCQPMDNYAEQIEALRAEPLENIETNWRGLTGTVDLSKDKIMCFGIPYEAGWSVYVDDEKRELMQANIGLMAVELEAGHHDIELKYWTPGLTAGIIMSLAGVLAVCGIVIFERKNKFKTTKRAR